MAAKKEKEMYFVSGYDERLGHIEGDTWAFSPDQAASFVAIRFGVPPRDRFRLRHFIDTADVVLITVSVNKKAGSKTEQLTIYP